MNFACKCMQSENIILVEVIPNQKDMYDMYSVMSDHKPCSAGYLCYNEQTKRNWILKTFKGRMCDTLKMGSKILTKDEWSK